MTTAFKLFDSTKIAVFSFALLLSTPAVLAGTQKTAANGPGYSLSLERYLAEHISAVPTLKDYVRVFAKATPGGTLSNVKIDLGNGQSREAQDDALKALAAVKTIPPPPSETDFLISVFSKPDEIEVVRYDFDSAKYISQVQRKIKGKWKPPNRVPTRVRVMFGIRRTGEIDNLKVVQSSGSTVVDQAALNAVKAAAPFPTFDGFPKHVDIDFTFEYRGKI